MKLGQRIAAFHVQVEVDGVWQEFGRGFTVAQKRLLRGPLVRGTEGARDDYRGTIYACID